MRVKPVHMTAGASDERSLATLAKLAASSFGTMERELQSRIASLETENRSYNTTVENISQGVCLFDREERLIRCNKRYAEIYGLAAEQVPPGTTLMKITECRVAAGTSAMTSEAALTLARLVNSSTAPRAWTVELRDGRTIHICHQPLSGGGWVATHEDITDLKATRATADERVSLQTLIDWMPEYLWIKDAGGRFLMVNKALAADCGRSETNDMIGLSDFELHEPDSAREFHALEQNIIRSGQPMVDREECIIDATGGTKWYLSTKVPLRNERGEVFGLLGIARDITTRKLADDLRNGQSDILQMIAMGALLEDVLAQLLHLVESQLTGLYGSVSILDDDGMHLRHGAAPSLAKTYVRLLDGIAVGPKVGSCGTAAHRREAVVVSDIVTSRLWEDYRDLAAAHGYRSCWSTPILSHQGAVLGVFALYSMTEREPTVAETRLTEEATRIASIAIERRLAENRIRFMAKHDALTGLPNRSLLKDRLEQAILYAQRYGRWVSVLFIDLDNFKTVNDSLGHNAGDDLLKAVARRMLDCVRAIDTVVRLGGDEFVILLADQPKDADVTSAIVQKLRAAIAEPISLEGHLVRVTGSIGIASYPSDGVDADALIANADAAMYRAKEIGRDNFQFYTPELNLKVHDKFLMQEELRSAVAHSEFVLHYQPQVDLRSGKVFAVEALIRWEHPRLGTMEPNLFIPIAEETGLIVPIGDWVLHEACRQSKAWQDAGLPHMNVCVNISARQFREKRLLNRVARALNESGLEAKYLELELTESLVMQDIELAVATMHDLEGLGVQLSIDDFGTGYSSLSALKTFPVTRLKIDKSFIDNLSNNEKDKAVACAVISLGHKLNLKVIAEGVETDEQVVFLRENNCDEMQGFHFSEPVPAQDIEALLKGSSQG